MRKISRLWVLAMVGFLWGGSETEEWLDKQVKWIASRKEKKAFKQLRAEKERRAFIEDFWRRRDPTPGTERNEYKEEFYRRYRYANENFREGVPGWRTDRGRIYIIHGPPDQAEFLSADSTSRRRGVPGSGGASNGFGGGGSSRESIVWTYYQMPSGRYYQGRVIVVLQNAIGMTEADYALSESRQAQQQAQQLYRRAGVQTSDLIPTASRYRVVSVGRPGSVNNRGTDAPISGIGDSARMMEDLLRSPGEILEERTLEARRRDDSLAQLRQSVESRVSFDALPVSMVGRAFPASELTSLVLSWQIPFSALKMRKEKDLRLDKLDLIAQVRDADGQLVDELFKSLGLSYGKGDWKNLKERDFLYVNEFNLAPGDYTVQSVIREVPSGRTGGTVEEFKVEGVSAGRVTLSDLVLSKSLRQNFDAGLARHLIVEDWRIVPQADGRFSNKDRVVLYFKIFNALAPEGRPFLTAEYKFIDENGTSVAGDPRRLDRFTDAEAQTVSFSSIIDFSKLDKGPYRLQVSVVDHHSKTFAIKRVPLEIR